MPRNDRRTDETAAELQDKVEQQKWADEQKLSDKEKIEIQKAKDAREFLLKQQAEDNAKALRDLPPSPSRVAAELRHPSEATKEAETAVQQKQHQEESKFDTVGSTRTLAEQDAMIKAQEGVEKKARMDAAKAAEKVPAPGSVAPASAPRPVPTPVTSNLKKGK